VHLVEILLPVANNEGQPFDAQKYVVVREELSRRFGGITAFTRAPAEGSSHAKGTTVHEPDSDQKRDTCAGAWNYLAFSLRTPLKGFAEALFF